MTNSLIVKTRGGMLVALVMLGAIGFELRTVLGMMLGIDLPPGPYAAAVIAMLVLFVLVSEVSKTVSEKTRG